MTAATAGVQPIFVGGEWRNGSGEPLVSTNPADGSVNATIASASAADVAEAAERAAAALRAPSWRDLLQHERARILRRISDGISAEAESLALLQLRDNGKPLYETRGLVQSAAGTFGFFASALETLESEVTPSRGPFLTMTTYQPLGVVGAITPWNSPIASDAQKVAPALAAGCAVLLKPSELTPLVALELGRIAQAAGLPDGLLSVLPGSGATAGAALVAHPLVRKISFTGGTETGRAIGRVAAGKVMPVTLELGGKSPTIVFADANFELAINGVLFGIFSSQGQSCIAGSRLFVQRAIYDAFVERLVARTRRLTVGDPLDPATHLGPLISQTQREKVESYVALARAEGGTVLCGGRRPPDEKLARGTYYEPTIVAGLRNDSRVCQDEIFGPVLAVLPFDDEADVVAQANDTVYGLACGIWTADYKRAWRIGRAVMAGTVWVNTYKQFSISTPFAGAKASGIGIEKGRNGIRSYQQEQSVYWGLDGATDPVGRNLTAAEFAAYERDGVACVRGAFDDAWIERMRAATQAVLERPTPFVLDSNPARSSGSFTRDRFLSLQNAEFRAFSCTSPAPELAASAMRSRRVTLVTDLVFVKEPHTPEPTPWHHDKPYGWTEGRQLAQFWIPLDDVDLQSGTLEFVRGSHRWGRLFNMRSFDTTAADESADFDPVPDIDAARASYDVTHFDMRPGDCVLFSELTLHAAPGNASERRRRAISLHYAGDDATFLERRVSRFPFLDHGLHTGDRLGGPYFPQAVPARS